MYRALSIFLLLLPACDNPVEKSPEPTVVEKPSVANTEGILKKIRRRATLAQLNLQAVGALKRDADPVEDLIAGSTPEDIKGRLSALADNLETLLEDFRAKKRAAKAAPSVQKTVKAGNRSFVFSSTLLDVTKVECTNLGADLLDCFLTFKVLRSNEGIRFDLTNKDGARINATTVGIPRRTPVGELTTQEILIPQRTATLTFVEE